MNIVKVENLNIFCAQSDMSLSTIYQAATIFTTPFIQSSPLIMITLIKQSLLLFGAFIFIGCKNNNRPTEPTKVSADTLQKINSVSNEWVFEKTDKSKLIFKNEKTVETNLYDLQYIGQIPVNNSTPFLIFSGRHCSECDANISIYIHKPTDGPLIVRNGENRFQYPGKEKDFENDLVVYISRAFYGQVLPGIDGVIWYENRLLESNKMGRSVYLAQIKNGIINDTSYNDDGKLGQTIGLMKNGHCQEIKGKEYKSEP